MFGVKISDMQKIVRKVKKNHDLALDLYQTNNVDAMYLAGLIADEERVTRQELQEWVKSARWHMVGEYVLAGLAADSPYGWELGLAWIGSDQDHISAAGWATLSATLSVRPDNLLEMDEVGRLLEQVSQTLHQSPNRTRYAMNGYIISVGIYIKSLLDQARAVAEKVGVVTVDLGNTACTAPLAGPYIEKTARTPRHGKKRKRARS